MLPKPEKTSKKKFRDESEEVVVSAPDPEIKIATLRKKRLIVSIALIATVLLSGSFSVYRFFKNTHFSVSVPELPILSFNKSSGSLSSIMDKELSGFPQIWQISISDSAKNNTLSYTNSQTKSEFIIPPPDSKKYQKNSIVSSYLPGGVNSSFYSSTRNSDYTAYLLLQNPQTSIQISINILNGSTVSESEIITKISSLVQKIYWYQVSN